MLALTLVPSMTFAYCNGDMKQDTAASCAPGSVWDAATGTCVANPTS